MDGIARHSIMGLKWVTWLLLIQQFQSFQLDGMKTWLFICFLSLKYTLVDVHSSTVYLIKLAKLHTPTTHLEHLSLKSHIFCTWMSLLDLMLPLNGQINQNVARYSTEFLFFILPNDSSESCTQLEFEPSKLRVESLSYLFSYPVGCCSRF